MANVNSMEELMEWRRMAEKSAEQALENRKQARLALKRHAVELMLAYYMVSGTSLIRLPIVPYLFKAATMQGWVGNNILACSGAPLKLVPMLHNLLQPFLASPPMDSHDALRGAAAVGSLYIEADVLRQRIRDDWLLAMDEEKLAPVLWLEGNVPFMRPFLKTSGNRKWGVIFVERETEHGYLPDNPHVWFVEQQTDAMRICRALAEQKPVAGQRYVLPEGRFTGVPAGIPVEQMFW